MSSLHYKKNLLKIFLAAYFLFFSVAPLTYAFPQKRAPESTPAAVQKSPGISGRLTDGIPLSRHTTGILVKQKRAIYPEDLSQKISVVPGASGPKTNFPNLSAFAAVRFTIAREPLVDIHTGFNPLSAGNSPPSA